MTIVSHEEARAVLHTKYSVVVLMEQDRCIHCGSLVEPGTHPVAHTPPGWDALPGGKYTTTYKCALCGRLAGSVQQPPCSPGCGQLTHEHANQVPVVIAHPDGVIQVEAEHCDPCHRAGICGQHNAELGNGAACVPLEMEAV